LYQSDVLKLTCVYNTVGRSYNTKFGLSTIDEMCLSYLLYYPKLDVDQERCHYADFTNIANPPYQGRTAVCGSGGTFQNLAQPASYTPYTPPACSHVSPFSNLTTPTYQSTPMDLSLYSNKISLDNEGKYHLYWNMDRINGLIHGALEVATTGWVGFGISPGGMEGADILMGWVKKGRVYLSDRFATARALPSADTYQDFYNIRGYERGGLTTTQKVICVLAVIVGGLAMLAIGAYWYRRRKHQGFVELKEDSSELDESIAYGAS